MIPLASFLFGAGASGAVMAWRHARAVSVARNRPTHPPYDWAKRDAWLAGDGKAVAS